MLVDPSSIVGLVNITTPKKPKQIHRTSYLVRLSPAKKYAIMAVTNTVVIMSATAIETGIIEMAASVQMTDP